MRNGVSQKMSRPKKTKAELLREAVALRREAMIVMEKIVASGGDNQGDLSQSYISITEQARKLENEALGRD